MGSLSVLLLLIGLIYTAHCQTIGRGTIRLVRNGISASSYSSGIVQIYYSTSSSSANSWGNICDDTSFGSTEASVICNQLGYNGASTYGRAGTSSYGTDLNATILDDVSCSNSNYLTLEQCSVTTTISSTCSRFNSNDAYVVCYTTRIWNNPYSGQIRLQGGTYTSYGRLEVYCNGQWGTVCDDTFDATDARVTCHQLGYSDSLTHHSGSTFAGSASQPIWLDSVYCSSSDNCLASCESCPSSQYDNCGHSEDIAVACEFDTSQTASTNTLSTCQYANKNPVNVAGIVGGVIAVFVICCALIIGIPICICCCLGVGIGAAARGGRSGRAAVVTTGATATVTTSNTTAPPPAYNQPPPPPPPPAAYPAQQGYPVQPGYPPPQGYPPPPPYPPQY